MKSIKFIWRIISSILVGLVVIGAMILAIPRLIGLTPFSVLSGSMEPTYHTGSLIYVKKVDASNIKVGDAITFLLNEDLVVATHRVIRIEEDGRYFYTKGDANDTEDVNPVYFENIIGKPVFTIPYMGYVSNFVSTKQGKVISATIVIAMMIISFIPDIVKKLEKSE